jgi:ligand-binding SRPBCC domain-containing protein
VPTIRLETFIGAPIERCFDLMRNVDAHAQSTFKTRERAVGGKISGLLGEGDEVTWEAVHFGVKQRLTARVTHCAPPHAFEDEMVRGAFKSFVHRHTFRQEAGGTVMVDDFTYRSPLGLLGVLADKLFLERYMRAFLNERARALKQMGERAAPTQTPRARELSVEVPPPQAG